jgi:hypothetical protein
VTNLAAKADSADHHTVPMDGAIFPQLILIGDEFSLSQVLASS